MTRTKLFIVNKIRTDVKVRVRAVHDRVGVCRQSQIAVSTAFSTGKEESRRRAGAFRQVSQNQELTKIRSVYCAVSNDGKDEASDGAWAAEQSYRQQKQRTEKT